MSNEACSFLLVNSSILFDFLCLGGECVVLLGCSAFIKVWCLGVIYVAGFGTLIHWLEKKEVFLCKS